MTEFLGSLFQTKEEREKNYQDYAKKIFPYGDAQKEKILEILIELMSKKDGKYLMMHYILVKEAMLDSTAKDYPSIAKRIEKKRFVKLTPELKECIHILMERDLLIDENLDYPTAQELKSMAAKKL